MSTKNFTNFLCSFLFLGLIFSCNVIKEVTGGKTDWRDLRDRGYREDHPKDIPSPEHISDPYYVFFRSDQKTFFLNTENGYIGQLTDKPQTSNFTIFQDRIFFSAYDVYHELFSHSLIDGTEVKHTGQGTYSSGMPITVHNNRLYYYKDTGIVCYLETATSSEVCNATAGNIGSVPYWFHTGADGELYGCIDDSGPSLFKIDGDGNRNYLTDSVGCAMDRPLVSNGKFLHIEGEIFTVYDPLSGSLEDNFPSLIQASVIGKTNFGNIYINTQGGLVRYSVDDDFFDYSNYGFSFGNVIENHDSLFYIRTESGMHQVFKSQKWDPSSETQISNFQGEEGLFISAGPHALFFFHNEGVYMLNQDGTGAPIFSQPIEPGSYTEVKPN